ncbi:uncharacterized protein cubi_01777 [Cryptosporidium ubiquitum]|uniref:t-SNARE coiled-coil homology domain-containing protein n=1 Tax=Cryptosporidium ubiquitum TaxID=857276 RepID=A0A1J4MAQ1_9CRYT|nr:uncharacterized protein cubi_01777 [Cryptosporidium ubiquitum]OII71302.1 hypothetical protein cubi_01777 [Cryptosporidium ubiquitum]
MKSKVLPPFWVDLHVEAQEELARAKELISILQKTQQKRLLCVLKDNTMEKSEIEVESLTFSICDSFKRIEKLVQSISNSSAVNKEFDPLCNRSSINCDILRRNAEISIVNELNPLSQHFKNIQKSYMSELQKNYICLDGNQINYEDSQKYNQSKELVLTDLDDFNIEEIAKITRSIAELNSIFKEMSSMVVEQGSLVDRIDFNINNALLRVENAHQQISKAEKNIKNKIFSKLIQFLIVCISIEIFIIFLKLLF